MLFFGHIEFNRNCGIGSNRVVRRANDVSKLLSMQGVFGVLKASLLNNRWWPWDWHLGQGVQRLLQRVAQDSKGFAMLESIMAITIFASLGTAVAVGIRTADLSTQEVEGHSLAEKLARNQMEYVLTQNYKNPGPSVQYVSIENDSDFTVGPGFNVSADAVGYITGDTDIEKALVTVTRDSHLDRYRRCFTSSNI